MISVFKALRTAAASSLATGLFLVSTASYSGPGTLSDEPLFLTNPVEPNVLFLIDDSGSMDWGLMTPESDGIVILGCGYFYAQPATDNADFWVVPTEKGLDAQGILPPYGGVWRAWNSDYNQIYYDPEITYTPWEGENNLGVAYGDVSPTAAPLDPWDPAFGTADLITVRSYSTDYCAGGLGLFTVNNFFPASYYRWGDTDLDDIVDAEDAHVLIEIVPTTLTYAGSATRSDCAAAPICTYAEEIQNFANWFSYYRKREKVAKRAYGRVIADGTGMRLGITSLHNNGLINTEISTMNADPTTGNKGALLDSLYSGYGTGHTPLRTAFDESAKYLACDTNSLFGSCPALPSNTGGTCQQNIAMIMTDGFYNGAYTDVYGNADGDDDSPWDSGTTGPYGDAQSATLADIAMEYYETDIHPTYDNELSPPPESRDQNTAQHVTTYTVAFGVEGTVTAMPANSTDPFAWPSAATLTGRIDDLRHAAFNGRGNFLSAQNPQQLIEGLGSGLRSVQGQVGSSASVAFNTGSLSTNSEVYLALFNSERWSGDLLSFDLDPLTGDVASTTSWEAGTELRDRNLGTDPRTILSYDGSDGIAFTWADLTTAQQDDFRTNAAGSLDNEATGMARHAYVRGHRDCEAGSGGTCDFRSGPDVFNSKVLRQRDGRLGDIVHSGPVFAGIPESNWPDVSPFPGTAGDTYSEFRDAEATRRGVIYVGANDGTLHGFAQDTGEELLAYVPSSLYSTAASDGLHYLSDPAYAHRYHVDLTPSIADVYARTTSAGTTDWHTVLVGGLRGGGRGLFALDVTDPSAFSESGSAPADIVMWEFTSTDEPDLGHTFSKPAIVPLEGSGGTIRWGIVVGNGYNDLGTGEAKLFILLLQGGLDGTWTLGTDYVEISTGVGSTLSRNGLATPAVVDTDGDRFADTVYAGDLFGNMWAFDISGTNMANWDVAYSSGGAPAPLFTTPANQQITSTPVVVRNKERTTTNSNFPNTLVIFGTGQYVTSADITTTDTQSFYGVWDAGTPNLSQADLIPQTIGVGTTTGGVPGRTLTNNAVSWGTNLGWYMNLPTSGERIITDPVIRGDLVFFNSMIPDTDPCNFGGTGWLMVAKWTNGGRPDVASFDLNRDGYIDSQDAISGTGAAGTGIRGIPTSPVNLGNRRYVSTTETTGGSTIQVTEIIDIGGSETGRLSWEELTP